jgi:hypothetical protein
MQEVYVGAYMLVNYVCVIVRNIDLVQIARFTARGQDDGNPELDFFCVAGFRTEKFKYVIHRNNPEPPS